MSYELKNGQTTEDPRLDRLVQFDDRSRNFPVTAVIETTKPRSYHWSCKKTLDQGREGACVGYAWTHELIARPYVRDELDWQDAVRIYKRAQSLDEWPGEAYSGTSVIAGVKAAMEFYGGYSEYRWAFGIDDLILALGYKGPAVLGIAWYNSMYTPVEGWLTLSGRIVGGHAILARGVNVKDGYVTLHNSWGPTWGVNGDAKISIEDLSKLLDRDGEACVPLRSKNRSPSA